MYRMVPTRGWWCFRGFCGRWREEVGNSLVGSAGPIMGVGWSWSFSLTNINESRSTPSTLRSSTISLTSSFAPPLFDPSMVTRVEGEEADTSVILSVAPSRHDDQSKSKEGADKRSDGTGDCNVSEGNGGGGGDDVEEEDEHVVVSPGVSNVKFILLIALFVTSATTTPSHEPLKLLPWSSKEAKSGIAICSSWSKMVSIVFR